MYMTWIVISWAYDGCMMGKSYRNIKPMWYDLIAGCVQKYIC